MIGTTCLARVNCRNDMLGPGPVVGEDPKPCTLDDAGPPRGELGWNRAVQNEEPDGGPNDEPGGGPNEEPDAG